MLNTIALIIIAGCEVMAQHPCAQKAVLVMAAISAVLTTFGAIYKWAKKIYEDAQKEAFLKEYRA